MYNLYDEKFHSADVDVILPNSAFSNLSKDNLKSRFNTLSDKQIEGLWQDYQLENQLLEDHIVRLNLKRLFREVYVSVFKKEPFMGIEELSIHEEENLEKDTESNGHISDEYNVNVDDFSDAAEKVVESYNIIERKAEETNVNDDYDSRNEETNEDEGSDSVLGESYANIQSDGNIDEEDSLQSDVKDIKTERDENIGDEGENENEYNFENI